MENGLDLLRRAQGDLLQATGFGPAECAYDVVASGPHWRLRDYGGDGRLGGPLLVVAAPIKRPYLWDLTPSVSALRYCLDRGLRIYLLEWTSPEASELRPGLDQYAGEAIGACIARIAEAPERKRPVLIGHSLGGTFAAIHAAVEPEAIKGLVLLGAPLCFDTESSRFRDSVVAMAPADLSETGVVPGFVLSEFCALASPEIFLWSRFADFMLSLADPAAVAMHLRIERWALDELPLPGRLVDEVLKWLYRENRFYRGSLEIAGRQVGPAMIEAPTLAVVTSADDVVPKAAVAPFLEAMPEGRASLVEYPGEAGVGLQHLALLAGRRAYATVWPKIMVFLDKLA